MALDSARYPRASAYVASLPQGLASFPECRVKREAHEEIARRLADLGVDKDAPEPVAAVIVAGGAGVWLSEVVGNTILLMARDVAFASDERFFEWSRSHMMTLASKPLYRMLLRVLAPSLMLIGAAKRWSAFHTGTWITSSPISQLNSRNQTIMTLTHPPKLYNRFLLDQLAAIFTALLEISRGMNGRLLVRQPSDKAAEFVVSWDS